MTISVDTMDQVHMPLADWQNNQQRISDLELEVHHLNDTLESERILVRQARRELDEFKTRVRDRMIEEAERRNWCTEFDDIMVEFGFEPRYKTRTVMMSVGGYVRIPVLSRDDDHAIDLAKAAFRVYADSTYDLHARGQMYHFEVNEVTADEIYEDD
jgi:protein-L-isoaspartate O-methyltransferase